MSNVMDKLTASRKTVRTSVTNLTGTIEALSEKEQVTTLELEKLKSKLSERDEELAQLNKQIDENLPEDASEADLSKEYESVQKYKDKICDAKTVLKILERRFVAPTAAQHSDPQPHTLQAGSHSAHASVHSRNIPNIQLRSFEGTDITKWPSFWDQFCAHVHENPCVPVIDKFLLLRQTLKGGALTSINGLETTAENYDTAVSVLKSRFDRRDLIADKLIMSLVNVSPVGNDRDVGALRNLYDFLESRILQLEALGKSANELNATLFPVIYRALPRDMALTFQRLLDSCNTAERPALSGTDSVTPPTDRSNDMSGQATVNLGANGATQSKLRQLLNFLRQEVEHRENVAAMLGSEKRHSGTSDSQRQRQNTVHQNYRSPRKDTADQRYTSAATGARQACFFCERSDHASKECAVAQLARKKELLQNDQRCYRCLTGKHPSRNCRKPGIQCKKCNSKSHPTAMHDDNFVRNAAAHSSSSGAGGGTTTTSFASTANALPDALGPPVCLQTLQVWLKGQDGKMRSYRALLDSGSQTSFIRSDIASTIASDVLDQEDITISTFGRTQDIKQRSQRIKIALQSKTGDVSIPVEVFTVEQVCNYTLTPISANIKELLTEKGLTLGDPTTLQSTAADITVDLLIGGDFYWCIVSKQQVSISDSLVATKTKFGYVLLGKTNPTTTGPSGSRTSVSLIATRFSAPSELEFPLEAFWEYEHIGIVDQGNPGPTKIQHERSVQEAFEKSLSKQNGRYVVNIPFKTDAGNPIPDNKAIAAYRLNSLLNRLNRKDGSITWSQYDNAIMEYLNDGHAERIEQDGLFPTDDRVVYYMPHKAVVRPEKSTPVRIVFDASSHKKGVDSLNDRLETGPNLNPDLVGVLLNFRSFPVAITSDIRKAFLQIGLNENNRDAFRFIWVARDVAGNLREEYYRMTRLPFGATCSPFVLAATIRFHLRQYNNSYPSTTELLDRSLYVDDLIAGVESIEEARILKQEAETIMSNAGMEMRKWRASDDQLDQEFTFNSGAQSQPTLFKVLGLAWCPKGDCITFDVSPLISFLRTLVGDKPPTKRVVLQVSARLFDPIGLLSPFVIRAKVLFQQLWKANLQWDDFIPDDVRETWLNWAEDLTDIASLSLPRFTGLPDGSYQVHVFCDASQTAYAAAAYIRCAGPDGQLRSNLLMAKTRVSPIKAQTIPRLELMGAVLAVRLRQFLQEHLRISVDKFFMWTDSQIILHWIKGDHAGLKQFVANRVNEIRAASTGDEWGYVSTADNPADIPSRGATISQLLRSAKWWAGPSWLTSTEDKWPQIELHISTKEASICATESTKTSTAHVVTAATVHSPTDDVIDLNRFSTFDRAVKVAALLSRVASNAKKHSPRRTGLLTAEDVIAGEKLLIRLAQRSVYRDEIDKLRSGLSIDPTSPLHQFRPFLDADGILRLGGRLQFAGLSYSETHPIILPPKHRLSELISQDAHVRVAHSGVQQTLSQIRDRFWIMRGRQMVRKLIGHCGPCRLEKSRPSQQSTAPLPADRIQQAPAFATTGVDFAGPFYVKGVNNAKQKAYVALFTCSVTRAVHLELVSNMTTRNFMMALRRFFARRGIPSKMYSDNALTFKRASADLEQLFAKQDESLINTVTALKRIKWNFIVDRAAWWGGFWERLVGVVKNCLRRVLGRAFLNFEELTTVLTEVEAIVNSRPITYVSGDGDHPVPLTPATLLIGRTAITSLPDDAQRAPTSSTKTEIERHWHRRQAIVSHFFRRWTQEYLLHLRSAHASAIPDGSSDLQVGDIVLFHNESLPKQCWPLCRVVEVFPGRDNRVRSCSIKTPTGITLKRPVQLLYKLEV